MLRLISGCCMFRLQFHTVGLGWLWVSEGLNCVRFLGSPGVLGIWIEWLFIFRELGSTGNYFQGFGEQAHSFGDLGSLQKRFKKKSH